MGGTTVFLTGASGFVGKHVLSSLLRRDCRVRCLVRPGSTPHVPAADRVEVITGDLLNADDCRRAAQGADAAVHLVGIIRERGPRTFQRIHVDGTRNVLEACRDGGIRRLAHMSALGAFTDSAAQYRRTKAAAERLVVESPLRWTIFRPSLILGPEGGFFRMMVDLVRPRWRPVPILGNGRYVIQPVGVDVVADLFARCLAMPETDGQKYELGGPKAVTFDEFVDTLSDVLLRRRRLKLHLPMLLARAMASLAEEVLKEPPFTREQLAMLTEARPADLSAARRDFQWQPRELRELITWCLSERSV